MASDRRLHCLSLSHKRTLGSNGLNSYDINVNFHFLTHLAVPKLVILVTMVSEFELVVLFSFHSTGF